MIKGLLEAITFDGDRGAVVPFSRLAEIKKDMVDLSSGEYHTSWLDRMTNHVTNNDTAFIPQNFKPRSFISIVIPSPKLIFQFNYLGKSINCVLPPHYMNWTKNNKRVLNNINSYLEPLGFSANELITFPHKMLAVHCGLALYGRNNICYNDEFGSYMQIMTYISNIPSNNTIWYPLKRMDTCDKCSACVRACPTGAIDINRRLINSDRCITFANELPGELPEWISSDAHNSITGCTKCQDCCPNNVHNKGNIKIGATFTEEETSELLNNTGNSSFSDSLAIKIETAGISPEYTDVSVLPRNIRALFRQIIE